MADSHNHTDDRIDLETAMICEECMIEHPDELAGREVLYCLFFGCELIEHLKADLIGGRDYE